MGKKRMVTIDLGNWNCYVAFDYFENGSMRLELRSSSNQLLLAPSLQVDEYAGERVICMKRGKWTDLLLGKLTSLNIALGWTYDDDMVICYMPPEEPIIPTSRPMMAMAI